MSDELKPCPFCGAPAEIGYPSDPFEPGSGKPDKTLALVMCSRACVNSYASTNHAIAAWNTRKDIADELVKVLENIANTFDDSWQKNSLERMTGDKARKAIAEYRETET